MTVEDIALTMVTGIGTRGVVRLLEVFGSAERIFAATADEIVARAELRADLARRIVSRESFTAAERELRYCDANHITPIASTDKEYPSLMREVPDYPHILYIKGDVAALSGRCLSIVGTRRMTTYGQRVCDELIRGLAEQMPDVVIVSGLAFGIDGACHRTALSCGLSTVGIIANTLPDIMPAAHCSLARDMEINGGAVVTELNSQTKQNGTYYIARNRLIAALSGGTIVVESPLSGGSLVTAQLADGYNRTVMAVPGRMTDVMSKGVNALIANRKAQMVLSATDVVREMMWDLDQCIAEKRQTKQSAPSVTLTDDERGLMCCFRSDDPVSTAELMELSGLGYGELSALLMGLELSGAVRLLPGNRYERILVIER